MVEAGNVFRFKMYDDMRPLDKLRRYEPDQPECRQDP